MNWQEGQVMRKLAMAMMMLLMAGGVQAAAVEKARYLIDDKGLHVGNGVVINQDTEATTDALSQLLKGFRVKIEEYWGEGSRYFRYGLYDGSEPAFYIMPQAEREPGDGRDQQVGEMEIHTRKVADRYGIRAGDTFRKLRATGKVVCGANAETGDLLLCEREGERLQFVFRNRYVNNPDGAMGAARPDGNDRILYIRWYAPYEVE